MRGVLSEKPTQLHVYGVIAPWQTSSPGQKWAASLVVSRVRAAGIEEDEKDMRKRVTRDKEAHGGVVDGTASRGAQQQKRAGGIIKHNTNAVKNLAATQAVSGDNVDEGSSPERPGQEGQVARQAGRWSADPGPGLCRG
eukprot:jgi/Tetstr1/448854/TSEL_036080.t1